MLAHRYMTFFTDLILIHNKSKQVRSPTCYTNMKYEHIKIIILVVTILCGPVSCLSHQEYVIPRYIIHELCSSMCNTSSNVVVNIGNKFSD